MAYQMNNDTECMPLKYTNPEDRVVNWMSMDETQFLNFEKSKDGDSAADCDDTDDSEDEDDYYEEDDIDIDIDHKYGEYDNTSKASNQPKKHLHERGIDEGIHISCLGSSYGSQGELTFGGASQETNEDRKKDFNHFIILRKGEPYVSPKNPGEHVLYDNPGVRRKVFYPNQQNPILCPVKILEEEKAMRPSDASCPSCLFLCIKYGGRTRNLPQNEYVRQRMGRNKLKSFGPVMCQMAMLVHIRSGSFFFKALGITLLFMAGFPDDLVQRETKYRNLDLLQKYYRTDEDAEGEELFLSHPVTCDTVSPDSQQSTGKVIPAKSKGKKQTNSTSKPHSLQKPSILQPAPSTSAPVTQFGLMGYTSIHTQAIASFQSMTSHAPADALQISNPVVSSSGPDVSFHNQTPYPMFPPQPANAFMPMMYWPPPNTFPPCPYPTSYGYQSFPSTGNYMSVHPQPYYSQPSCNPFIPKMVEDTRKNDVASEEADSDSDSSSSTEPKQTLASCK
ncbi:hypothetical protein CK203_068565 [Vitis vinifera]|uniref:Uncharacterized protein n=1 Tax=Vitis vinifera TaxID=29760 RepID=A0A438EDU4_VITVI|nr:hypothetical protein CK203_068565 [Vitis vinifera]